MSRSARHGLIRSLVTALLVVGGSAWAMVKLQAVGFGLLAAVGAAFAVDAVAILRRARPDEDVGEETDDEDDEPPFGGVTI